MPRNTRIGIYLVIVSIGVTWERYILFSLYKDQFDTNTVSVNQDSP